MNRILLLLFIIILPSTLLANLSQKIGVKKFNEIKECFKNAFYDEEIYQPYWCNRNTKNLYGRCFADSNIENINVIFLLRVDNLEDIALDKPGDDGGRVYPLNARSGLLDYWPWHVFLDVDGTIFDLDFKQTPNIVDVQTYFEQMYKLEDKFSWVYKKYVIRKIPADEYYYDHHTYWDYYVENWDGLYPLKRALPYFGVEIDSKKQR